MFTCVRRFVVLFTFAVTCLVGSPCFAQNPPRTGVAPASDAATDAATALTQGNEAQARKDTQTARQQYQRAQQLAGNSTPVGLRAGLNLIRIGSAEGKLQRLLAIYDQIANSSASQTDASLYLNVGHQAASLGNAGMALAWRSLDKARALSAGQPGLRPQLEALDGLAQLYEAQQRYPEALLLSQQALMPLRADTQRQNGDLHVALEWRQGRIYRALGQNAPSLGAYQRAVTQLEILRPDVPIEDGEGRSSYRTLFEPVYLGLVDGLLKAVDTLPQSQHAALLRQARDAVELVKQTELQDYLGDRCVVDAVKGGSATVIPPRTAVLYPIMFPDRLELLLETALGLTRFTTPIAGPDLQRTADLLVRELRSQGGNYEAHARQLYDWVLRPLDAAIASGDIETLVVIPDASLRTVPLGALHDGTRFAIEKYAITTATGLSMTNTTAPLRQSMTALVAGASSFGGVVDKISTRQANALLGTASTLAVSSAASASSAIAAMSARPGGSNARAVRAMGLIGARNLIVSAALVSQSTNLNDIKSDIKGENQNESLKSALALPGVTKEMLALQAILPGTRLMDAGFTLDAFRQAATAGHYRIVHVASHGVFGGSADSSYILAYDDLLTLDDLQKILSGEQFQKRPIEILSLSACETAAGNDRAPLGISGAAMKARAKSVLGTLWPVDDEAAVTVMTQFYTGVAQQGQTKARALQQSQVHLIRHPQMAHPFFWAPFALIGNWL